MEKENTSPLILSSNVGSRCYLICIYLSMLPLILFITLHTARWSLLRTQMLNYFAFVQLLTFFGSSRFYFPYFVVCLAYLKRRIKLHSSKWVKSGSIAYLLSLICSSDD